MSGDRKIESKKIHRQTQFFQEDKFKEFQEDIKPRNEMRRENIQVELVEEISIKCYGYGYFEEPGRKMQTVLKGNLIRYLREAIKQCINLKTLKLDFNGFSIKDGTLLDIIEAITAFKNYKHRKQTIWIQVRFLRDCNEKDFKKMLDLANQLVSSDTFEEINLMLAGWEFEDNPLKRDIFQRLLTQFAEKLSPKPKCYLKRLKLDLSSWYMHNLEAYNLLSEIIAEDALALKIEGAKNESESDNKKKESKLNVGQKEALKTKILEYLQKLNRKYQFENPIPGKGPHYITVAKQYEKRKVEKIREWKKKGNVDNKILLNILNDEGSIPEQYKVELKSIMNQVETLHEKQEKKIKQEETLIEEVNELEKEIGKAYVKFPFDFVMGERVRGFQSLIQNLVQVIAEKLEGLEEFQLDLRNWNRLFQMGELKKNLDKEFSKSGDMKLVGGAISQIVSRINATKQIVDRNQEQKEEPPKGLKLTFVM